MLEAENIMLFYENMLAVNNISFRCEDGQIIGIFGSNSAGKSSLMYAVSGIILDIKKKEIMKGGEKITVLGEIKLDGQSITHLKPCQRARRGMVLCPERRRIFPESSTLENLKIGSYLVSRSEAKDTLKHVFTLFPHLATDHMKKRSGGFLSGGEQQMLAIGRALMAKPKVLLLDEPLLGLSPALQSSVLQAIRQIREQTGISIVVAEQYAGPVLPIVDYAYIIENGSAVMEGTSDELMANPDVKSAYFGL